MFNPDFPDGVGITNRKASSAASREPSETGTTVHGATVQRWSSHRSLLTPPPVPMAMARPPLTIRVDTI